MPDTWNAPRRPSGGTDWFMQAPLLTGLLCLACVVVTLLSWAPQWTHDPALAPYANLGNVSPDQLWEGRYWGLVTTVFLHGNPLHLLFNLIWLYQLGTVLERTLNSLVYALFLVAAAAIGSGCELAFATTTGIGMSGVVYAMFGLMWAGRGRFPVWGAFATPDNLRLFIGWGVFCFIATQLHWFAIANAAHAGGFLFGLAAGWLFASARPWRGLWAVPLAGLLALTVLSVTWMPWSGVWDFWKGNHEYERGRYHAAIAWYDRSRRRGFESDLNWNNIAAAWSALGEQAARSGDAGGAARDAQNAEEAARNAGPEATGGQ